MKRLNNRWFGFSVMAVLAVALLIGLACSQDTEDEDSEARGTLYLVDQDWNGQLVTTAVIQILLEKEMDHTVATKFAPADSAPLFIGLEEGDFHFVCCNWPSYSAALLKEYVDAEDDAKVDRMGTVGITGETGWYVPSYVINGDAERGIAAVAPRPPHCWRPEQLQVRLRHERHRNQGKTPGVHPGVGYEARGTT